MEADGAYAPLLMYLLGHFADRRAILLRVAFVLGNLTTTSNEYRWQVWKGGKLLGEEDDRLKEGSLGIWLYLTLSCKAT